MAQSNTTLDDWSVSFKRHPVAESNTALSVCEPILFFNTTLWHRATLLSWSMIACVSSVSVPCKKMAKAKERGGGTGRRHPVAQSDTALSHHDRWYLLFSWCHRVALWTMTKGDLLPWLSEYLFRLWRLKLFSKIYKTLIVFSCFSKEMRRLLPHRQLFPKLSTS